MRVGSPAAASISPDPEMMRVSSNRMRRHLPAWLALASMILCAGLIRLRLVDIPLERDEGEYACAGQLMLHGIAPYRVAWNMKFPGTYAAYAAIMSVLGQSIRAIHLGLLAANAATTVLVYVLARRWFSAQASLAAAGTFALISLGSGVLGMAGHATHFVTLFAVAATLLLFRATDTGSSTRLFCSGLLFGAAFLMKQQGIFFALFGGLWLLRNRPTVRKVAAFSLGAALPSIFTGLILWQQGAFEKFWFWTFRYAREYASEDTLEQGWDYLRDVVPDIVTQNAALWAMAAAGLVLIWRRQDKARTAFPITSLLFFSFLSVCPGLIFREHYFIVMLPAVALLTGATVETAAMRLPASRALWLWGAAVAISLFLQRDFLFRMTPMEACRYEYALNPFPEAIRVADYLRSVTRPGSRIAVFGSERRSTSMPIASPRPVTSICTG